MGRAGHPSRRYPADRVTGGTYDSGALIAAERGERRMWARHRALLVRRAVPVVPAPVVAQCSCSRTGVANMLRSFSQDDRDHMIENGVITVTCEFCNSSYVFEPQEIGDQTTDDGRQATDC